MSPVLEDEWVVKDHFQNADYFMPLVMTQSNSVSIRPRIRLDLDMKKVYFEPMERYGSILKLSQDDEEKELEFELNYLASLTWFNHDTF
jgi:hypothetical protein